jgi:glycosyltransferase involved in cell wall biosynthesis
MIKSRISVIVPAFQAAGTIGRAIDSVLQQTRPADDVLIVDDGSRDALERAVGCYGSRITLLRKRNGGVASARNLGLDRATGEFIAFLDADDYWAPTKLQRQMAIFEACPDVGLVASHYWFQKPGQSRFVPPRSAPLIYDRPLTPRGQLLIDAACSVVTSTVVIRAEVLNGRRFDVSLSTAEDRDLWLHLAASTQFYLISEPLNTFVHEPGSLSRSNVDSDWSNMLRVVRRHGPQLQPRLQRQWEADVYRGWASEHLAQRHARAALRPAWRRWRLQPVSPEACWILAKSAMLAVWRGDSG